MTDERQQALDHIRPFVDAARGFTGWTFDAVTVRHLDAGPPWDYETLAREAARGARSIADLGTGGGERFAAIIDGVRARAVATEEWHINAPVAHARLRPLGADVVRADSLRLPFAAEAFELVLDRHEALEPAEVARVLMPGGAVITQQVGPNEWPELRRFFPEKAVFPDHFNIYQRGFRDAGLVIDDARWHERRAAYATLGDVVFMMLVTPGDFPEFEPDREIDRLLAMKDALGTPDGIELTEMRYIIRARKPA